MFRANTGHLQVSSWKAGKTIRMSAITKRTSILKHNGLCDGIGGGDPDIRGMGHTPASNAIPNTEAQTFESISRERLQWNFILIYMQPWRRTMHQTQSNVTSAVSIDCSIQQTIFIPESPRKVKQAICVSYSTAALRHIVLLPEWAPSIISRGAAHTKRRERPLLAKEGTIPEI